MADLLALVTIIAWSAVPLFWIPVHCCAKFFRKLGLLTYGMPLITWLPLACFIYSERIFLLHKRIVFPDSVHIIGMLLILGGTMLHIWTGILLGRGLIGLPEINGRVKGAIMTRGPFSVVRHPTYLAHTMIFLGVFFVSGVVNHQYLHYPP